MRESCPSQHHVRVSTCPSLSHIGMFSFPSLCVLFRPLSGPCPALHCACVCVLWCVTQSLSVFEKKVAKKTPLRECARQKNTTKTKNIARHTQPHIKPNGVSSSTYADTLFSLFFSFVTLHCSAQWHHCGSDNHASLTRRAVRAAIESTAINKDEYMCDHVHTVCDTHARVYRMFWV